MESVGTGNDSPTHIVADELLRHIVAAGPGGVSKRGLLAGLRADGGKEVDGLIRQWALLGQIKVVRKPDGETILRWAGHRP